MMVGHQNKAWKDRTIINTTCENNRILKGTSKKSLKNPTRTQNTTYETSLLTALLWYEQLQATALSVHQLSFPVGLRGIFPGLTATNSWEKRGCRKLGAMRLWDAFKVVSFREKESWPQRQPQAVVGTDCSHWGHVVVLLRVSYRPFLSIYRTVIHSSLSSI